MNTALTVIHVLVCLVLILVVLLQTGKGSEMGAAFGGASQTVFGSGGSAPFLSKFTTGTAIVFMLTSLFLATISIGPGKSLMDDEAAAPISMPAIPPMEAEKTSGPVTAEETAPAPIAVEPKAPATEAPQASAAKQPIEASIPPPAAQPRPTPPAAPAATEKAPAAAH